ncbi:MAG: hypothetical protein JXA14_12025 [Anaerolineae bacterium]|nr:hypothetical protein [Anaerolineae bacterium]
MADGPQTPQMTESQEQIVDMVKLEDLKSGLQVKGILFQGQASVVGFQWHGTTAIGLFYKCPDGEPGTQLLFRSDERRIGDRWMFIHRYLIYWNTLLHWRSKRDNHEQRQAEPMGIPNLA